MWFLFFDNKLFYLFLSAISARSFDNIESLYIPPTKATIETDKLYPWGINLKIENGQTFKTRVEDQELFIELLENGALIGKRENSSDIYCYMNNDTICIPIQRTIYIWK